MEKTRERVCDGCGKPVPISDLRYRPKGNDLLVALCSSCRTKTLTMRGTALTSKPAQTALSKKPVEEGKKKKLYLCTLCKYKFKADPQSMLKCPYCGKTTGIREQRVVSSETLIKSEE